jgi:maltooligosyltrehalose trehalohydrolase
MSDEHQRRFPIGAEPGPDGTHFRVWAPRRRAVDVALEGGGTRPLAREAGGYFAGRVADACAGTRYRFRLDGGDRFPDPASRFQPDGPHGPSEVVDPAAFRWTDAGWRGVSARGQVLYEMHVGTFTREGTFAAAAKELPRLAETGITTVEMMPVADFPGRFGWGYDGVNLFAPTRLYGGPHDLRAFVDAAHGLGLGVILDVVYNHLGPDGNYLGQYATGYVSRRHTTEWGDALNFDGEDSGPVREYFVANARYWVEEFHLDGLRLDATQDVHDDGPEHVLRAVTRAVREGARGRETLVVAENEPQVTRLVRPSAEGGYGMDAAWNDDYHHAAFVALTGRREAYFSDHRGRAQELAAALRHGYLFQGQWYTWQKRRRGTSTAGLPRRAFVHYLENHDQLANATAGRRTYEVAAAARYRALLALTLLGPSTPLLFQGQEFGASAPFLFFADHQPDLAAKVRSGRREFVTQFPTFATTDWDAALPDPADRETFERCVLDHAERARHPEAVSLHADLLRLRREDPVFAAQGEHGFDAAALDDQALVARWTGPGGDDRLLVLNLGPERALLPAPEPLLAPPSRRAWRILWSSEDLAYGGLGTPPLREDTWALLAESALALAAEPEPAAAPAADARRGTS